MLFIHRSNRAEALVDALAAVVRSPSGDPQVPECICVQGRGIERWLAMELAKRLGVWGHAEFPFPSALLERVLAWAGHPAPEPNPWEPEALTWSVAAILERVVQPGPAHYDPLRTYIYGAGDDGTGGSRAPARLLELAARVARLFDRYIAHRPELLLGWEAGESSASAGPDGAWQAALWREVVAHLGSTHFAARAHRFAQTQAPGPIEGLPPRICCFGIASLPPLYITLLGALAQHTHVHLFVVSPSREYWGEIRSRRGAALAEGQEEELIVGHPLLASMGTLGRDFQRLLEGAVDYQEGPELYVEPSGTSLLAHLQRDILHLTYRRAGAQAAPQPISPADRSVQVHSCHSPMREIEVLHDQLLALFEADPTLRTHEVVVMSPAIDRYAPLIEAVFGGDGRGALPARVADRAPRAQSPVIDVFERLLELVGGRFTAPEVVELLGADAVRERFDLSAEDLEHIRAWVIGSGVRWGADAEHRQEVEQPAFEHNTWRFGLDRLLLGVALPPGDGCTFGGVLPFDGIEGQDTEVLGKLVEACHTLLTLRERLRGARPVATWVRDLIAALESVVRLGDLNADQAHSWRAALVAVAEAAQGAGFTTPLELSALRPLLTEALESLGASRPGFLAGGITFCDLVPMRSIPFRVVCLVGMGDAEFPRLQRPLSFDLMAQGPRLGDRTRRDDDRYLFLEALLSAREHLIITYVGQSITDHAQLPPSVVVAELLDAAEEGFYLSADAPAAAVAEAPATEPAPTNGPRGRGAAARNQLAFSFSAAAVSAPAPPPVTEGITLREHLVLRHPLQPFSPRYFGGDPDGRLFSYAETTCRGARTMVQSRRVAPSFMQSSLSAPPAALAAVSIEDLVRFIEHPVRSFLVGRMGIRLEEEQAPLEDREPMVLTPWDNWRAGDLLLRRVLANIPPSEAWPELEASGMLPLGVVGRCTFEELVPEVEIAAAAVRPWIAGEPLEPINVDETLTVEGKPMRLFGRLQNIWEPGLVHYGFAKLGRRSELGVWVRHLVLNAFGPSDYPRVSRITGRPPADGAGTVVTFDPAPNARELLEDLLAIYRLGMHQPLPLFAGVSRLYVEVLRRSRAPQPAAEALSRARSSYYGGYWNVPAERDDPYIRHVFGNQDPVQPGEGPHQFEGLAQRVFSPMLGRRGDAR